jgi:hypothetical protein
MEKKSKLGIAATSLAAAATMVAPATASADAVICDPKYLSCPGPGDQLFLKIDDVFLKVELITGGQVDLGQVYAKIEDVFIKIG